MKLSTKTRYGLTAMIALTKYYPSGQYISLVKLSEELGISKIYLEQIFYLLKQSDLLLSVKGPKGGYRLAKEPGLITMFDIFYTTESDLFIKTADETSPSSINQVIDQVIVTPMSNQLEEVLKGITLAKMQEEAEKRHLRDVHMYYI